MLSKTNRFKLGLVGAAIVLTSGMDPAAADWQLQCFYDDDSDYVCLEGDPSDEKDPIITCITCSGEESQ